MASGTSGSSEPLFLAPLVQARLRGQPYYPWRVLVACALLNRTRGSVARPILGSLLRRWPSPNALAGADRSEVERLIAPLGLQRRRSARLIAMSGAYVHGVPVENLPGVGRYALDSWAIFVEGRSDVDPDDIQLRRHLGLPRS